MSPRGRGIRRWQAERWRRRRERLVRAWYDPLPHERGIRRDRNPLARWANRELGGCRWVRGYQELGRVTKRLTSKQARQRARAEIRRELEG